MLRICGVLSVLLIVPAVAAAAEPAASPHASTIEVVSQGSVAVTPDRAVLDLGVKTDKKTATAAIAENDRKMELVLAALKKELGASGDVKTSEFSVTPRFAESRRAEVNPPILGYTVSNTVHVRVDDVKAVGRLLDRAFQAGANTVENLEFTVKDPEAAQNAALRAASAKARARATAIADGLGVRVGQVISVNEPNRWDHIAANVSNLRGFDKAVPIEAGSVTVAATVAVVFAVTAR